MRVLLRSIVCLTIVLLIASTMVGYAEPKQEQVEGEIVGIAAKARLDELTSGDIKNMAFAGKLSVLLPDGKKVDANCNETYLKDVKGCPKFNKKEIRGGFIATITVSLKEHQKVMLVRNQSNGWNVAKILK